MNDPLGRRGATFRQFISSEEVAMDMHKKYMSWDKPGKALVTGASAGLGLCFARQLAQKGFDLVLLARRRDRLENEAAKITKDYGVRCDVISADLSDISEIAKISAYVKEIDQLDILVNNAGFATIGHFADVPIEKSMRMHHLHMDAPVMLSHAAMPGMIKRKRGAIINVSSMAAFIVTPGNAMYNATKAFLVMFSESLQMELKDTGVRIQALCPGFTRTEFHEVGDFENFDRSTVPDGLWMSADEAASLSLAALEHNKEVIFIPGWKNRLSTWLIRHSRVVRSIVQQKVK